MWHLENGSNESIHRVSKCGIPYNPLTTYVKPVNAETAHKDKAKQMAPNVHGFIVKHENGSQTRIAALVESIPGG